MSSPLYRGEFLEKKNKTVRLRFTIVHPDVSNFGTDRLFAWKLLSDWVSPPDHGDELELAARYVESVKLSPLKNAKVARKAKDYFTVERGKGQKPPTVVYTIKVTDPALL